MASKIVFIILMVLKVNIVWTASCPSNVHEMMTSEEISQTFGTDDGSVPDYRVMSMVLPGAERRRQADDKIHMKVEINNAEMDIIFEPTARYLATKYTAVWFAVTDQNAYNKIRYDPLPNAMMDIGAFEMYQDVYSESAIVVYTDLDNATIVEGIITADYAIKSVPKRVVESASHHSIPIQPDVVTGYVVLFKSPHSAKIAKRNVYRHVEKRQTDFWEYTRSIPKAVYPEILLVLDHNAIRKRTITQALRFMLAFWNSVDMVYSALDNPKVYLNIAGIIISADDTATPYITEDTSIKIKLRSDYIPIRLAKYFAIEVSRFPFIQYDMIIAMTPIRLCGDEADSCENSLGSFSSGTACTLKKRGKLLEKIDGVGIMNYNWMFDGVNTAVHETAHLFDVSYDENGDEKAECSITMVHLTETTAEFHHQSLEWAPCSEMYLRRHFSTIKSLCLDNTPMWTKPVDEVLPGRWLTLDGQCQNNGFEKSCQIPDYNVCWITGCKAQQSNKCEPNKNVTLPGTKCGVGKFCRPYSGCVYE